MQEQAAGDEQQGNEMEYDDSTDFDGFNTYVSKENRLVVVKTIETLRLL
jgi:hypothetical protein